MHPMFRLIYLLATMSNYVMILRRPVAMNMFPCLLRLSVLFLLLLLNFSHQRIIIITNHYRKTLFIHRGF
jgi:hypothetical protein